MKITRIAIYFTMLTFLPSFAHAYYFEDGFESGDWLKTNAEGWKWSSQSST